MKEIELKCACGRTPAKRKLPNGKWQVRCQCGKKTWPHGRKGEATKEWNAKYAPKGGAAKAAKKAPAKPAPKPAPKAEKKPCKPAAHSADTRGLEMAEMLAILRTAAVRFVEAIDTLGTWAVSAFDVRAEDVMAKMAGGEARPSAKVMTVEVSPETAKRLLKGLQKLAGGNR